MLDILDMNGFAELAREEGGTPADWYFRTIRETIDAIHYLHKGRYKLSDKSTIKDVRAFVERNALLDEYLLTTVAVVYHKALQGNSWAKEYYGVEL